MSQNDQYRYVSAARAKSKKKSRVKVGRLIFAIFFVLALLALAIFGTWKILSKKFTQSYIRQDQAGQLLADVVESTPDEYKGDYVSILVAGIANDVNDPDYDPAESGGKGMTDIIMYVSYDVKNGKVNILQIPRDTYVGSLTSTGKINAVYGQGQYKDNPITNLAEVINTQLKLPVDYYGTVDVAAFTEIIDLLGGIDMYVPYDIYDDVGNTVTQGSHHIDGATARWILRQRHCYAQADIQRMETQQYFYAACFRLFKSCSVRDLTKVLLPIVSYRVNTNMDFDTMCSLAVSFLKLDSSDIYLDKARGGSTMVNGQSVFVLNPVRVAAQLNERFRPYGDPVDSSQLGLATGIAVPVEIEDSGKYLVNIMVE